jgi:15-cis-phytoene synthase
MMTLLMGARAKPVLARACDLGVAMQLTNIARDVGEDARNGRVYLPRTWLSDASIDRERFLVRPEFSPALGGVVSRLLDHAEVLYVRSESGVPSLPADCRISIRAARLIYGEIGNAVRRNGYDSIHQRATTSTARKFWLLLRATRARFALAAPELCASPLFETEFLVDAATATSSQAAEPVSSPEVGPGIGYVAAHENAKAGVR